MRVMYEIGARTPAPLMVIGTMILSACGDGTTEPHDDHGEEVEGVELVLGG